MRLSSCLRVVGLEGLAGVHDRPEHVDAAAGQGDDGLMVAFAFAAFAGVEGTASWRGKRAEGRLVEDPLEVLVAASGPAVVAGLAGLAQHRGQPGGGGELVGGGKAAKVACLSDELGGQGGPHAGQAADEGRVRVAVEQLAEVGVQPGDPLAQASASWASSRIKLAASRSAGPATCWALAAARARSARAWMWPWGRPPAAARCLMSRWRPAARISAG